MADAPPPNDQRPLRARRWSAPRQPPQNNSTRTLFRLIGIPALAIAGVLIYRGIHERFTLPDCDSSRAKQTLSEQFKLGSVPEDAIKTISSSKEKVVCSVAVPSGGRILNIDYTFLWQGDKVETRISIALQPASDPSAAPKPQTPQR
jgi:hypothetical protein